MLTIRGGSLNYHTCQMDLMNICLEQRDVFVLYMEEPKKSQLSRATELDVEEMHL